MLLGKTDLGVELTQLDFLLLGTQTGFPRAEAGIGLCFLALELFALFEDFAFLALERLLAERVGVGLLVEARFLLVLPELLLSYGGLSGQEGFFPFQQLLFPLCQVGLTAFQVQLLGIELALEAGQCVLFYG